MARFKLAERPISAGAANTKSKLDLSFTPENRVPVSHADFVENFAGGSEDRALEWVISHVITDENNDARAILRDTEAEEGETKEKFMARVYAEAAEAVKTWDCVKTRRVGMGAASKAKALDEILKADAGKQAELLKQYAAKYGLKQ